MLLGRASAHLDCVATASSINPWKIVTAPGHALVRRKSLRFGVLAEQALVVRKEGSGTRAAMQRLLTTLKAPMNKVMGLPEQRDQQAGGHDRHGPGR